MQGVIHVSNKMYNHNMHYMFQTKCMIYKKITGVQQNIYNTHQFSRSGGYLMIIADKYCIIFEEGQKSIFEDSLIVSTDWFAACMHTFDYQSNVCRSRLNRDLGFAEHYFYHGLEKIKVVQQDKNGVKASPSDVKDPFLKYQV